MSGNQAIAKSRGMAKRIIVDKEVVGKYGDESGIPLKRFYTCQSHGLAEGRRIGTEASVPALLGV